MAESGTTRIGPAGWSYRDWVGPVYPPGRAVDELLTIARWFDCVELNSSFYRLPSPRTVRGWAARIAERPGFTFTVKAPKRFTHERSPDRGEVASFVRTFDPLLERNALGAFLLQFPWSFRNTEENRGFLASLADGFSGTPAAVELRHASWRDDAVWEFLEKKKLAFCNIDQPVIGASMPPTGVVTDPRLGYIRLHGRNYRRWFDKTAGRDDRYDYLYGDEELDEWRKRAVEMAATVKDLYIITNNHFRGQALVNAFQMKAMLGQPIAEVPVSLVRAYPALERIAPAPPQGRLI